MLLIIFSLIFYLTTAKLIYREKYLNQVPKVDHIAIFIHAAVYDISESSTRVSVIQGVEIVKEMLDLIVASTLIHKIQGVFIGLYGSKRPIKKCKELIRSYGSKFHVIARGSIDHAEFPTLFALQQYAKKSSANTKLLYIHTKGMFPHSNGWNKENSALWRRYMMFFMVEKHDTCVSVLASHPSTNNTIKTCGTDKTFEPPHYSGNFWWSTAGYIRSKQNMSDMQWTFENRYAAEMFILSGLSEDEWHNEHYCIHSIGLFGHNPYKCATPRWLYENASVSVRPLADCGRYRGGNYQWRTKVGDTQCFKHGDIVPDFY